MSEHFSHEREPLKRARVQWTWLWILGGLVLLVCLLLFLFVGRVFEAIYNVYDVDEKPPAVRNDQP